VPCPPFVTARLEALEAAPVPPLFLATERFVTSFLRYPYGEPQ
jgi:hypothetical protein